MTRAAGVGLAALSILVAWSVPLRAAPGQPPGTVGLASDLERRVGRQLRRELVASGFPVIDLSRVPAAGKGSSTEAPAWLVTMDLGGTRVLLRSQENTPGARPLRASFPVDPGDEVSIRRAALALVERLRLESGSAASRELPAAATRRESRVPSPPGVGRDPTLAAPGPAVSEEPRRRPRAWSLGASPTLDLPGGAGRALGHVQILGETPLGAGLVGRLRVLWPLFGTGMTLPDRAVRLWTMGAAVGLRLPLGGPGARLQPFVAGTGGLRLVLSDTNWFEHRHGEVGLTPALVGAASGGLRFAVRPLVHLVLELTSEWSRTLPSFSPRSYEREIADAHALRVALGVCFDY